MIERIYKISAPKNNGDLPCCLIKAVPKKKDYKYNKNKRY